MTRDDDNTQSHVALTKGTMVSHYRIVIKIGIRLQAILLSSNDFHWS